MKNDILKNDNKQTAYEPIILVGLNYFGPIFIFCIQIVVILVLSIMIVRSSLEPIVIIFFLFIMATIGILILALWSKTFFKRNCQGLINPFWVKWSDESLHFKGPFFSLEVPLSDIIEYKEKIFGHIVIIIKTNCKWNRKLWLKSSMHNRKALIDFLEEKLKKNIEQKHSLDAK